ncbi:MAG: hypothetical protein Q3983_07640 [Capnocytophaga sp.]|nr:hypothetical protein [Capnocytophaga sp.]
MKTCKYLLYILCLCYSYSALAQVTKVTDPTWLNQEKRQVFEDWAEFKPDRHWFWGDLTYNWALVWGYLAPRQNRNYRRGDDIRPLRAGGQEQQKTAKLKLMQEQAKVIRKEVDSIKKRALSDFAHWNSQIVEADPLYLLYYKRMLSPLKKFPEQPASYQQWGFANSKIYNHIKSTGQLPDLQEKLSLLKELYKKAHTLEIPRGKRFLMFHKTLMGWRELQAKIQLYNNRNNNFLEIKDLLGKAKQSGEQLTIKSDKEVAEEIFKRYKHKF